MNREYEIELYKDYSINILFLELIILAVPTREARRQPKQYVQKQTIERYSNHYLYYFGKGKGQSTQLPSSLDNYNYLGITVNRRKHFSGISRLNEESIEKLELTELWAVR